MDDQDIPPVEIPVNGTLDLHMFAPRDAVSVVGEYLKVCHEKKLFEVRIIHGKGKGVLRRAVHEFLKKHPLVSSYSLDSGPSGWGATVVRLRPL